MSLPDPSFTATFTPSISENGDFCLLWTIRMRGTIWRTILLPGLRGGGCRWRALHWPAVWNTYRRRGELLPQNEGGMRRRGTAEEEELLLLLLLGG